MMKMGSAFDSKEMKTYLVDLILPNGVRFLKWRVAEIADSDDWSVIIRNGYYSKGRLCYNKCKQSNSLLF